MSSSTRESYGGRLGPVESEVKARFGLRFLHQGITAPRAGWRGKAMTPPIVPGSPSLPPQPRCKEKSEQKVERRWQWAYWRREWQALRQQRLAARFHTACRARATTPTTPIPNVTMSKAWNRRCEHSSPPTKAQEAPANKWHHTCQLLYDNLNRSTHPKMPPKHATKPV
jgi:hypothetical protein